MTFIFDTGSAWLWVPSDACPKSQCPGNQFHYGQSSTYQQTGYNETVTYGKGQVKGYVVQDQVSLTSATTGSTYVAQSSKFLSIYEASDISGLISDGLLGLSPNFISSTNGELLIASLKKSGAISKQMFALYLASTTKTSQIQFGGYDQTQVLSRYSTAEKVNKTAEDLICWVKIVSKAYWQVQLDQATVNGQAISIKIQKVVFDSGASLSYVPSYDYYLIYNAIFDSKNTAKCAISKTSQLLLCDCTSVLDPRYPSITFRVGQQYNLYFNNSDYLIYDSASKKCIYSFIEDSDTRATFWLLGDPFLRAYYTIYDMDNQRIGFAGKNIDNGSPISAYSSSDDDSILGNTTYIIIICVIGGVTLLVILCIICICCLCKKKNSEQHKLNKIRHHKSKYPEVSFPTQHTNYHPQFPNPKTSTPTGFKSNNQSMEFYPPAPSPLDHQKISINQQNHRVISNPYGNQYPSQQLHYQPQYQQQYYKGNY